MSRATVIDVDLHLAERPADLAPYCDLPWRHVLRDGSVPPWNQARLVHPFLGVPPPAAPAPARSAAELRERMDGLGVEAALVLPGPLAKLGVLPTDPYAVALASAYNRWLAEAWLADGDRLFGAVIAAPQDPEAASREIERYAAHERVRAVFLPVAGLDPMLGDARYDPIYAAAEAAGHPVVLHSGIELMLPDSPHVITQFSTQLEQLALSHPLMAMGTLVHMVGRGVLARFPELRLVFLESGVSWLGHMMLRMDKEYSENRRDVPFYTDRVSGVIKRQVWVGTQPIERGGSADGLETLIGLSCGVERVLYGSHWPYADFDPPERVAGALASEGARRRVLEENARELFGIPARSGQSVASS
jgi:predicted TIM-barrel fold metal-dependent hydrolase